MSEKGKSGRAHVASEGAAPERYLNRELSWVEFNARVLEEAQDESVPLLERIKFLAILAKNLDEFAEVRVPRFKKAIAAGDTAIDADGFSPLEVLDRADRRIRELEAAADRCWLSLVPGLAAVGIRVLEPSEWTPEQRKAADEAFAKARPALAVAPVEAAQPFPLLKNGQLCLALANPASILTHVVIFGDAPRLVALPAPAGQFAFARLEDAVRANLGALLPGTAVGSASLVRLTRDTNFYLNEGDDAELMRSIAENAHNDAEDLPVRLQFEARALTAVVLEVARRHGLALEDLFGWGGFPSARDLFPIAGVKLPALQDPPQPALEHPAFRGGRSLFEAIAKEDVLLYHPYHSFDPVIRLVTESAKDPAVKAIHMTLYRTSSGSPIVAGLLEAAKAGKKVFALVEAKARFDEEGNIERAKALGAAGAQVSIGQRGLKTHMKGLLVEREEGGKIKRYAHLATGNYNEKAAKMYGDLSYFTADEETTDELAAVFRWLEGGPKPHAKRHRIWNAPDLLRDKLEDLIAREAKHAKEGRPARIIAKLNAIADREIIDRLYDAADAGVQVDVIVRGACTLRPGSGKVPARLRGRRIVDRYLEHARVLYFSDGTGAPGGGKPDVYLSSADWMGRNLDKRVELLFKVRGERHVEEIKGYLDLQLADDVKGRKLERDGSSSRVGPAPGKVRCQQAQYELLKARG